MHARVSSTNNLIFEIVLLTPCALMAHSICLKAPRLQSSCLCVPLPWDAFRIEPVPTGHLPGVRVAGTIPSRPALEHCLLQTYSLDVGCRAVLGSPEQLSLCPGGQPALQTQLDSIWSNWGGICTWRVRGTLLYPIFLFVSLLAMSLQEPHRTQERRGLWEDGKTHLKSSFLISSKY